MLLISLAIVLITLLIPLLSNTEFHRGIPLKENRFSHNETSGSLLDSFFVMAEKNRLWNNETYESPVLKKLSLIVIPISIAALLIFSVLLLVSAQVRKKIFSILLGWMIVIFTFYMVFLFSYNRPVNDHWQAGALIQSEESETLDQMVPEPDSSRGLSFLYSSFLFLLTGGVIYLFYRRMKTFQKGDEEISIKDVTEKALTSIREGSQISDIIIRCYNDMVLCLREERGITRSNSMTAGEFKLKLLDIGLPEDQVEKLTSLFERVRYGREPLSGNDEKEAELCLKSVVAALEPDL